MTSLFGRLQSSVYVSWWWNHVQNCSTLLSNITTWEQEKKQCICNFLYIVSKHGKMYITRTVLLAIHRALIFISISPVYHRRDLNWNCDAKSDVMWFWKIDGIIWICYHGEQWYDQERLCLQLSWSSRYHGIYNPGNGCLFDSRNLPSEITLYFYWCILLWTRNMIQRVCTKSRKDIFNCLNLNHARSEFIKHESIWHQYQLISRGQNGRHFTDDTFKRILMNEKVFYDPNFTEVCSQGSNWQ